MKEHTMIVVALMVVMAISTTLLASSKDVRDLSYLNASTVVTASTQLASGVNDTRDVRDLSYLNSSGISGASSQNIALQNDRRDARDLAYLFGNSKEDILEVPNNTTIICCQR